MFKRLNYFLILAVCLVSMACFSIWKNNSNQTENALAYNYFNANEEFWNELNEDDVDTSYNLSSLYPMVSENQTTSQFCWLYSSMKSLESAFMVQKNEYYNFSEVGQAYLISFSKNSATFNTEGNFVSFAESYQTSGLILESDVSNNLYNDILDNGDRLNYYSYLTDYASKELNDYFLPIAFANSSYYASVENSLKLELTKKFIKNYGGLYAGIEGGGGQGCFYSESNETTSAYGINIFYDKNRNAHADNQNLVNLDENHAITIIGWNDDVVFGADKGAFIALNSWGFEEKSIDLFYIPYSYSKMLNTFCGFICNDNEMQISIANDSSASYNSSILNSSRTLNNYFCYDDEIKIDYKLNAESLENVSIEIRRGNDTKTKNFEIFRDESKKIISVKLNHSNEFYGGYYTINFYQDSEFIGKRGLYVFSATEIGNFKIASNNGSLTKVDGFILNNAFFGTDNVATINVNPSKTYMFSFNFANTTNYTTIMRSQKSNKWRGFNSEISELVSDISVTSSNNKKLEVLYTKEQLVSNDGLFIMSKSSEVANQFVLQLGYGIELSEFPNSLITFKIKINSLLYENCAREYNINLFVSGGSNSLTSNLNTIVYDLDGGENDERNITKYPKYTIDANMTEVELYAPTKIGSIFMGWYSNPRFEGEPITNFSNELQGNITLYAKWEKEDLVYFNISLTQASLWDYDGAQKEISDDIIYGDKIWLNFAFSELPALRDGSGYSVFYYFYGAETESGTLDLSGKVDYIITKTFKLDTLNLKSGNHSMKIKVIVEINNIGSISKETSINITVNRKKVDFEFENIKKDYNGQVQKPDVIKKGFYAEDLAFGDEKLFVLDCGKESKNADDYIYQITELINENYYFDGEYYCEFTIERLELILSWENDYYQVYDGKNHPPSYTITNLVEGDKISFDLTIKQFINAGHYVVNIDTSTITNGNYTISSVSDFEFDILKAKVKIKLHSVTERVQTKSNKRVIPEYSVIGNYYTIEDMQINVISEGLVATKSGKYIISCSLGSSNYEYEVEKATYTLTGFYYVYYQLENGKAYAEKVEEGGTPTGVTKKQLKAPLFSKIDYSDEYIVTGNDIYVAVSLKDYSGAVYMAIFVGVFGIVCLIYYLKKRGSSVR